MQTKRESASCRTFAAVARVSEVEAADRWREESEFWSYRSGKCVCSLTESYCIFTKLKKKNKKLLEFKKNIGSEEIPFSKSYFNSFYHNNYTVV